MPLHTISICAAVTPTVVGTCVSHYANRKPRRNKPTAHIGYDLGLNVVRGFIKNMANHTVEDVQGFTGQWVPAPTWVKIESATVPQSFSDASAKHLFNQLGPRGIEEVGGEKWWQWRKDDAPLKGEWIEMRKDFLARAGKKSTRILLYIHGGAYYFGSVDEHRYQIQRHARKLKARAFAPRYRLAPQFPFPCGLHDALTAYTYLLSEYDPKSILVAGDSAGGGMVASLLVVCRDQGLPLPAGAILLSPWVDLTHSFPSICGDGKLDYIPTQGFIHRPSVAWPPPRIPIEKGFNEKDVKASVPTTAAEPIANGSATIVDTTAQSNAVDDNVTDGENKSNTQTPRVEFNGAPESRPNWIPAHIPSHHVTPRVELDGKEMYIQEQIQLYAPNYLLVNPLVSPALNPSLGGLCPLLIQVGSGELLSDEQVYFAHKAANPIAYPPSDEILDRWDPDRTILNKYPPTNVQLQVWDDLCHVPHTLAWTKPAKYMYRSAAQFGAWALARAQHTTIDIDAEDSSDESDTEDEAVTDADIRSEGSFIIVPQNVPTDGAANPDHQIPNGHAIGHTNGHANGHIHGHTHGNVGNQTILFTYDKVDSVGRGGDPLPPFVDHMIRQRVDRHGKVYPMGPASMFFSLMLKPEDIGIIKEAPVHRWLERQIKWEKKCARQRKHANETRQVIESEGMPPGMENENPPPTAQIRRWLGEKDRRGGREKAMDELKKRPKSIGLKWWSGMGSKHDEETMMQQTVEERRTSVSKFAADLHPDITRRKNSVIDEGQADHLAIHSGTTSPLSPTSPAPVESSSNQLQVPKLDSTGRSRSASTLSSSSVKATKSTAGSNDMDEKAVKSDPQNGPNASEKLGRPEHERFYSAKEMLN